jgi:predicted ATPase
MSRRATLFGREREQALLLHRLGEALGGQGGLVLIGGEAGIGKTALAAWLAAEARRAGARVFLGGCDDLTITPPFGPWIEAFAAFDVEHPLRPDALGGAEGSQQQLFAHVHAFLARMAGADGLLLVLDDLHWADPASVELLRAQARRVVTLPVLLVATYRLDDLPAGGPLSQALPVLVREGTTERIDLPALDTSAVRALVVDRYAPPPADAERLTAYLHQRSGGNPFFLSEVLRALEFERRLVPDSGGWRVGALDAILPPLVRQAIEGRLRYLSTARGCLRHWTSGSPRPLARAGGCR